MQSIQRHFIICFLNLFIQKLGRREKYRSKQKGTILHISCPPDEVVPMVIQESIVQRLPDVRTESAMNTKVFFVGSYVINPQQKMMSCSSYDSTQGKCVESGYRIGFIKKYRPLRRRYLYHDVTIESRPTTNHFSPYRIERTLVVQ